MEAKLISQLVDIKFLKPSNIWYFLMLDLLISSYIELNWISFGAVSYFGSIRTATTTTLGFVN